MPHTIDLPACTVAELITYLQQFRHPDEAIFAFLFTRDNTGGIEPSEEDWTAFHQWAKDDRNSDSTVTWWYDTFSMMWQDWKQTAAPASVPA